MALKWTDFWRMSFSVSISHGDQREPSHLEALPVREDNIKRRLWPLCPVAGPPEWLVGHCMG